LGSQAVLTRLRKDRYDAPAGQHHVKMMADTSCEAAVKVPKMEPVKVRVYLEAD